jgi:menaquinol-cytochrome c reductase iron-sulfur subunit
MTRRDFHRFGSLVLGGLIKLAVAVPAVAFILSPFRKRGASTNATATDGAFEDLASLSQLEVGVPRSFGIVRDQVDAWVKYPREPVGSVWLIRQPAGVEPPVIALTAECPHLGCAVNRSADGKGFFCPCHTSAFDIDGKPLNKIPPRPMDQLDVELSNDPDPRVRVRFQRFRALAEERITLA